MSYRVRSHGMYIDRYTPEVARYTMLLHTKADAAGDRAELLSSGRSRIHRDGLNSLTYTRHSVELKPLYTWLLVSVNRSAVLSPLGLVNGH